MLDAVPQFALPRRTCFVLLVPAKRCFCDLFGAHGRHVFFVFATGLQYRILPRCLFDISLRVEVAHVALVNVVVELLP